MNLPNLFIPGAAKSGTSSLHSLLGQHPDIFMSPRKEPHFYSHDSRYFSKEWRAKYLDLFSGTENFRFRGESSTGYMVFPETVDRIRREIEEPKFIFILRNPVDRAYSHYWWLRGYGIEKKDFKEAFLNDMKEEPEFANTNDRGYRYYFQFGCYGKWISSFISTFGKSRIQIITFESFKKDMHGTLNECFEFLGLNPMESIDSVESNKTIVLKRPERYYQVKRGGKIVYNLLPKFCRNQFAEVGIYEKWQRQVDSLAERAGRCEYSYPALSDREWVAEFYRKDLNILQELTGSTFSEWEKDFRSTVS